MLRALVAGGGGWRPPRLRGSEVAGLPRLSHLVLDSIDCPHGEPIRPCDPLSLHLDVRAHVAHYAPLLSQNANRLCASCGNTGIRVCFVSVLAET